MNLRCDCRSVFRSSILLCSLLASTCTAADLDIIFAGDFTNSQPIQWVRRHPRAGGASIALGPAYVTATRLSGGGGVNLTMYLQVPPELNGNGDYPLWSALKTFGPSSGGVPAIGDCVSAEGTIINFNGASELNGAVWTGTPGECGDAAIAPYVPLLVSAVATDADPNTAGNQPGASAESLESVLVRLNDLGVLTSNSGAGSFQIGDQASGAGVYLSVGGFLYQYTAVQGTLIASITGVLDEFDVAAPPETVYQLLPRSAADIVD